MTAPMWVRDAIFYQIFPDRFANGNHAIDPAHIKPWGSPPTTDGFQGGDLQGIMQHLDYLMDLGINAIYLNPIFQSPSTHRYNTYDYFRVDPRLGDEKDFHALLNAAHQRNMRILLDGVLNHCGRGFFAFNDILENQAHSGYKDWFHIKHFPVNAYSPGDATDYLAWWNFKSLPKFNTSNPATRAYLLSVVKYWTERGIDGWRLDVPNEIDDDEFWQEFRDLVRGINPQAYTVGELWDVAPRWVGDDHFDGVMHYPFRSAVIDLLNQELAVSEFAAKISQFSDAYGKENLHSLYLLLGSHDTERIRTMLQENIEKVKLAFFLLFTFPGVPAIYYGDEVGLDGGKDPECRKAFPWEESQWNQDLHEWVKKLIGLRKRWEPLRSGDYVILQDKIPAGIFVFCRTLGDEGLLGVVNPNPGEEYFEFAPGEVFANPCNAVHDLIAEEEYAVEGGRVRVHLPAYSGRIMQCEMRRG